MGSGGPARSSTGVGVARGVGVAPAHAAQRGDGAHAPRRTCPSSWAPSTGSSSRRPARSARSPRLISAGAGRRVRSCSWHRSTGWSPCCRLCVWCAVGARWSWWWHWFRERGEGRARRVRRGAAGHRGRRRGRGHRCSRSAPPCSWLLRLLFDTDPAAEVLSAARRRASRPALIGGDRVGRTTRGVLAARSPRDAARRAARGLGDRTDRRRERLRRRRQRAAGEPSADALVDEDPRTLLLGGISALVVGAPAWWLAWRPARAVPPRRPPDPARRGLPGGGVRRECDRRRSSPLLIIGYRRLRVRPRRRRIRGRSRGAHPRPRSAS